MPLRIMKRANVEDGDGCSQPASIILCRRDDQHHPFVTWRINDIMRGGDGGRYWGRYHESLALAEADYYQRSGETFSFDAFTANHCAHVADYAMHRANSESAHRFNAFVLEADWYRRLSENGIRKAIRLREGEVCDRCGIAGSDDGTHSCGSCGKLV